MKERLHTNYVLCLMTQKNWVFTQISRTRHVIICLFSTQSHPLGSYSSSGVHYRCWNVAKHMKYCKGCMESMWFYLVQMVSVLALVRPESEFITAYQKVSRSHMPDECLFSSSSSVHTLYLSRSGTQLSMHYFWEKEAVNSHFKVILQLKSCIRNWCHQQTVPCLSLSFSTCWQMAPVMVTGKSRTMPRPRFSLFLCWLNNFNSFFSSSSRELQYWGYAHTHTHTFTILLQLTQDQHRLTTWHSQRH